MCFILFWLREAQVRIKAVALAIAFLVIPIDTYADVEFSNFNLAVDSVTFNLSGTMPLVQPNDSLDALVFVNPDVSAEPGYVLEERSASTYSFSGTQALEPFGIKTGDSRFGDYFFVKFESNLSTGESISGVVQASFSMTVFNPAAVNVLDVYWGSEDGFTLDTGVLLQTVSLLRGDFDGDGHVTGSDFLAWQRDAGLAGGLSDWQSHYGAKPAPAFSQSVPEPTTTALVLAALCLVAAGCR